MHQQYTAMWFFSSLLLFLSLSGVGAVRVNTKYGVVEGQSHTINNGKEVKEINTFLGIPFAKPPVKELRWKAPEEVTPWPGVLKANKLSSACHQRSKGNIRSTHGNWTDYSEDCLYLNIFTPKNITGQNYPVFFWMYGGSFTDGANFKNHGYLLSTFDMIIVIPNYRMDALGFASSGDAASPGNYGLLDQQRALRFVKETIGSFGGDPDRVTIAGQSAGGSAVGFHMVAPSSQGLFHQAILQSGTDLAYWALHPKEAKPWTYTQQLALAMGCPSEDSEDMMTCLRTIPAEDIINFRFRCSPGFYCMGFGPVVDGVFISEDPFILRNQSYYKRVPTMSGIMEKDASYYVAGYYWYLDLYKGLPYEEFERGLYDDVTKYLHTKEHLVEDVYTAFRFHYTPWGQQNNMILNRDQLFAVSTDINYGFPSEMVLRDTVSHGVDTFSYIMTYRGKNTRNPTYYGATHSQDIPYVFGQNYLKRNPSAWMESGFTRDWQEWTAEDDKMADFVMALWSNFVKTGNPTPSPVDSPVPGQNPLLWEPYTEETRNSLIIDVQPLNYNQYRQMENFGFFAEYLHYLLTKGKSDN